MAGEEASRLKGAGMRGGGFGGSFFFNLGLFCCLLLSCENEAIRSSKLLALDKALSWQGEFPRYGGGGRGCLSIGEPLGGATEIILLSNNYEKSSFELLV